MIILISFMISFYWVTNLYEIASFSSNKRIVDVDEDLTFNWELNGIYKTGILIFGDGTSESLEPTDRQTTHSYKNQGFYIAKLRIFNQFGKMREKTLSLQVKNYAPSFTFNIPTQAYEDEIVNISVSDLSDSDFDLDFEKITLLYDFGEGTQIRTKNQSVLHSWEDEGIYPVRVSIMDDQGAISHKNKNIQIFNIKPTAYFNLTSSSFPANAEIEFNASTTLDTESDLSTLMYIWSFDDGFISIGEVVLHQYAESGNYNVTLTVKDDNDASDTYSELITVENVSPAINFTEVTQDIQIFEGESYTFSVLAIDDHLAGLRLIYWWNFNSTLFNPLDYSAYELGGWINTYCFQDDFVGQISVAGIDPLGAYDSISADVEVINVNPSISVWDASVVANLTFELYRDSTTGNDNNFTYVLYGETQPLIGSYFNMTNSSNKTFTFKIKDVFMSLAENWTFVVNSTSPLGGSSWFNFSLKLDFIDGQQITFYSPNLLPGSYAEWVVNLPKWYDTSNFTLNKPITFNYSIWDPSKDEIDLLVNYDINTLLEISCNNALPLNDTFVLEHQLNNISYSIDIYEVMGSKYANITAYQQIRNVHYSNNSFPVNIESDFTIFPIINLNYLLEDHMGLTNLAVLSCIRSNNIITTQVVDDDLGQNIVEINCNSTIELEVENLSPYLSVSILEGANLGENITIQIEVSDYGLFNYNWSLWNDIYVNYGHDNNVQVLSHFKNFTSPTYGLFLGKFLFEHQGNYLITINTTDSQGFITKTGGIINIVNPSPNIHIDQFFSEPFEDVSVEFSVKTLLNEAEIEDFSLMWTFGDGTLSFGHNPIHAWNQSGVYNITLSVFDKYGNFYQDKRNITVVEQLPDILGPYIFQGVEGRCIVLDINIHDSILEEFDLSYFWYDDTDNLFSTKRKPVVNLDDGTYNYTLVVIDRTGKNSTANVTLNIFGIAPEIFSSDYQYSGKSSEIDEGFVWWATDEVGLIELVAFAYDTDDDTTSLTYQWKITRENYTYTYTDFGSTNSTIWFSLHHTTIYFGTILVIDETGNERINSFTINSFIDSNTNGFSDEFESRLLMTGEEIHNFVDSDKDGLTNLYEQTISHTNFTDYDTDKDGLSDGNLGEFNFGSNPLINDTDSDGLLDGFEIFGWNISISYFGLKADFSVNCNPLLNDTDFDGLSDFDEYLKRSHPKNPDSDNDFLLDNIDPYPAHYDFDTDGLSDLQEMQQGTSLTNSDTDGDGINDGDEFYGWGKSFRTNLLSADSDHDFLADSAEIKSYTAKIQNRIALNKNIFIHFLQSFKESAGAQIAISISFGETAGGYGILNVPDIKVSVFKDGNPEKNIPHVLLFQGTTNKSRYYSQVIDIMKTIEDRNLNYEGLYFISVNNTNAGCLLEQFEMTATRYLNPWVPDYDKDGIMDGVETALLVNGISTIDFKDLLISDALTVDNNSLTVDEYTLTIPHVGRVYDADLIISVDSQGIPSGTGNISIELFKDELDERISDPIIIQYSGIYSDSGVFSFSRSIDITEYVNNDTLFEYYGGYTVRISISNTTGMDNFTLTNFYILTDTFIQASSSDNRAWITDPANDDTDGDFWSDYYEIYGRSEPTNPLSKDTDGDGAWDSLDWDPLRDVMIVFSPQNAASRNLWFWEGSPWIKVIMGIQIGGVSYCYVSRPILATDDYEFNHNRKAYFPTTHKYYLNIDDNIPIFQFFWLTFTGIYLFHFELWHEVGEWDHHVFSADIFSTISAPFGAPKNLRVTHTGIFGKTNEISVNIETVAIEKQNTIAIYENNSVFNGHYQTREKMNIIQLEVTDNGAGTPFERGVNSIVIPTSLFTKTLLNAQVQNKELDAALFPENPNVCKFISIERDGSTDSACDEIDFIILRYQLSSSDAMQILTLLLTCLINETTNETAICYRYVSTKENNTNAVRMNLPLEVLQFIVWDITGYDNTLEGRTPIDFWSWVANKIVDVFEFVVGIFIAIGEFFILLWNAVVEVVGDVLMAVIDFLAQMLWLLIRAALFIISILILAISVAALTVLYLGLGLIFGVIAFVLGCKIDIGLFFMEFKTSNSVAKLKSDIKWNYCEFFDMNFPYIVTTIEKNNTLILKQEYSLILQDTSYDLSLSNITFDILNDNLNETQENLQASQNEFEESETWNDLTFLYLFYYWYPFMLIASMMPDDLGIWGILAICAISISITVLRISDFIRLLNYDTGSESGNFGIRIAGFWLGIAIAVGATVGLFWDIKTGSTKLNKIVKAIVTILTFALNGFIGKYEDIANEKSFVIEIREMLLMVISLMLIMDAFIDAIGSPIVEVVALIYGGILILFAVLF